MAEKDANYYYNRAAQARANGNERLAQMMENYAIQLDRDYGSGEAGREGAVRPAGRYEDTSVRGWTPKEAEPSPALQEKFNNYQNVNSYAPQPQPVQQEQPQYDSNVVVGGGRDEADVAEMQMIGPDAVQSQPMVDPRTGGNYDPTWNANTLSMQPNGLPQNRYQDSWMNRPLSSWFSLDDSYGRALRDKYNEKEYDNP